MNPQIDMPIEWLRGKSFFLIMGLLVLAGCFYTLYRIEDVQKSSDLKCAEYIKMYCPVMEGPSDFEYLRMAIEKNKEWRNINDTTGDIDNNTPRTS